MDRLDAVKVHVQRGPPRGGALSRRCRLPKQKAETKCCADYTAA